MIVGNSFPGMVVVFLGSGAESAEGVDAERSLELLESCLEDLFLFFGFD